MSEKRVFFISTAIPYVNAAPHLGHALEFVQADIIARYKRLVGNDVFLLSGTDDNALKNVLKAEEVGEDVRTYVDRHARLFKDLLQKLSISNDDFIQTSSDERHLRGAQKLWRSFKKEDVVMKVYKGLYCVGCEEFKTEKELENGHCLEHPTTELQVVEEENHFFKLGNYQRQLEDLIESDVFRITPTSRKNEVLAFLRRGLEDLSISRSKERAHGWGVPVPGDLGQVQYVWVDALSNYITALGYADESDKYRTYWLESDTRVHVVGKGITRFHALYWPAFLLSAGVPLPSELVVHGYITSCGQKMSKSLGNVIHPLTIVEEYGADALRYYLARHIHPFEDSDFTIAKFKESYNADLANGLGNLAARILTLAEANLEKPVALGEDVLPSEYTAALDAFNFNAAADYVWARIGELDKGLTDKKPFALVKTDLAAGKAMIADMIARLTTIARLLAPIMPATSEVIMQAVRKNKKPTNLFPRKE